MKKPQTRSSLVPEQQRSTIRIVAIRQPYAQFEQRAWRPPVNIYETEQGIEIIVELAGVALNDLNVHVHPTSVQIQGARQMEVPTALRRVQRMEIVGGPFQIELPLAVSIDPERAEAQYTNGLLDVRLPFANQATQRVVVIQLGEGRIS
jgi:HSP20 family protein